MSKELDRFDTRAFFKIAPKEEVLARAQYRMKSREIIYTGPGSIAGKILKRELEEAFHVDASIKTIGPV